MKIYQLKEEQFEELIDVLKFDPARARHGSMANLILNDHDRSIYEEAFRFFNYHVHNWVRRMKE